MPPKFPTSILIKILEEFFKKSAVIWFCDKILWRILMKSIFLLAKINDYIMLQKFCFWLEFWSKSKQHSKIIFALAISSSRLEFEIPFDLVMLKMIFLRILDHDKYFIDKHTCIFFLIQQLFRGLGWIFQFVFWRIKGKRNCYWDFLTFSKEPETNILNYSNWTILKAIDSKASMLTNTD